MYLHGSPYDMPVGTVLRPGDEMGYNINGGKSEAVYLLLTEGFSLTECEDAEAYSNSFDFAVAEALWWGGDKFVYVVEPMGNLTYDDHHDVSPACVKTDSAKVVAKFDSTEYSFEDLCSVLRGKRG